MSYPGAAAKSSCARCSFSSKFRVPSSGAVTAEVTMTKRISPALCAAIVILLSSPMLAQTKAALTADAQLRVLITDFLDGAGRNDKAMHQRFWADDVTYTSAKGVVRTKADIMKSLDEPTPAD